MKTIIGLFCFREVPYAMVVHVGFVLQNLGPIAWVQCHCSEYIKDCSTYNICRSVSYMLIKVLNRKCSDKNKK